MTEVRGVRTFTRLQKKVECRGARMSALSAFAHLQHLLSPKTIDRNFEVPPEVLAKAPLLRKWALRALKMKGN